MEEKEDIVCKICGVLNSYVLDVKNNKIYCHCRECHSFIKFLPFISAGDIKFYFGKYKGQPISQCNDKNYLEWGLKKEVFKSRSKKAVEERLKILTGQEKLTEQINN